MFILKIQKTLEGDKMITNHSFAFQLFLRKEISIRQQWISDYLSISDIKENPGEKFIPVFLQNVLSILQVL